MRLKKSIGKKISFLVALSMGLGLLFNPVSLRAEEKDNADSPEGIVAEELEEEDLSVGKIDTDEAIWDVLSLVNQERAAHGVDPLVMDKNLINTAKVRADEIVVKFDHTRPDGTSCWTAYTDDVFWWASGENIAAGYNSPKAVMEGWMNSEGHRRNILDEDFNCIGIACIYVPGSEYGYYWVQNFGYATKPVKYTKRGAYEAQGIYVGKNDRTGCTVGLTVNNPDDDTLQYSWFASKDEGETWKMIQDWTTGNEWLTWTPEEYGEYILVGKARKLNSKNDIVQSTIDISYHPYIMEKCQMPYWGEGGGYLIGFETYDNPNQEYQYEMFVMDLSLYSSGSPTPWVHRTNPIKLQAGANPSDGKTLWTIWQPEYGYYLTLFRLYDKYGNTIDEVCYGFVNAY